ncbi:MAG: hypothetical protein ABIF18_00720 [archaeon]
MVLKWYEWTGLAILLVGLNMYGSAEVGDNNPLYFMVIAGGSCMILYGWFLWNKKGKKKEKVSTGKHILYIIAAIFFTMGILNTILPLILGFIR